MIETLLEVQKIRPKDCCDRSSCCVPVQKGRDLVWEKAIIGAPHNPIPRGSVYYPPQPGTDSINLCALVVHRHCRRNYET